MSEYVITYDDSVGLWLLTTLTNDEVWGETQEEVIQKAKEKEREGSIRLN